MEKLVLALLVLLVILLACKIKRLPEGFGMDDRPFEPENTLLHRNVWDDVGYVRPVFRV